MGPLRDPSGINPLTTTAIPLLFPKAHQLVTERPSVAQNLAFEKIPNPFHQYPRNISSTPEPLFQALSSPVRIFS
jgi:hypothetical protein